MSGEELPDRQNGIASANALRQVLLFANSKMVSMATAGWGRVGWDMKQRRLGWLVGGAKICESCKDFIQSEEGSHRRLLSRGTSDLGFKRITPAQVRMGERRDLRWRHGDQVATFSVFQVRKLVQRLKEIGVSITVPSA